MQDSTPLAFLVSLRWDAEMAAWIASVPALPGCISEGATIAEAEAMIREAIELHLLGVEDPEASDATNVVRIVQVNARLRERNSASTEEARPRRKAS